MTLMPAGPLPAGALVPPRRAPAPSRWPWCSTGQHGAMELFYHHALDGIVIGAVCGSLLGRPWGWDTK